MEDEIRNIYQAADVILLIISNEGLISDEIEYPSEFQEAYQKLLELRIVKNVEGTYVPAENFDIALRQGVRRYEENLSKPALLESFLKSRTAQGIFAGAALAGLGYLIRLSRRS